MIDHSATTWVNVICWEAPGRQCVRLGIVVIGKREFDVGYDERESECCGIFGWALVGSASWWGRLDSGDQEGEVGDVGLSPRAEVPRVFTSSNTNKTRTKPQR